MKNTLNSVVLSGAVALFAANANADDVQEIINAQAKPVENAVTTTSDVTNPRVTIQDYVEAARGEQFNSSTLTVNTRVINDVYNAL